MRTAQEVMDAILGFAEENDNIRMVGMEGSRVNRNIPRDSFQDFDVTYFVTDSGQLTGDDGWLSRFGKIVVLWNAPAIKTISINLISLCSRKYG